jgi:hypothetical protein
MYGREPSHDDHDGFRAAPLDLAQDVDAVASRNPEFQQNYIDARGIEYMNDITGRMRRIRDESQALGDVAARLTNGAFVVDDQKV